MTHQITFFQQEYSLRFKNIYLTFKVTKIQETNYIFFFVLFRPAKHKTGQIPQKQIVLKHIQQDPDTEISN